MAEMGHKPANLSPRRAGGMSAVTARVSDFAAPQRRKCSAINRHNQQLFDDLGGAQQNRWGYLKAERLGGLVVHDHLKLGRQLHREIARLLAAQDAIDIGGGATPVVSQVDSVGEQTAVSGGVRIRIDRRYVVSGRSRYDRRAIHEREYIRHDDKAASRLPPKGHDGRFDLYIAVNGRNDWRDLERPGRCLK